MVSPTATPLVACYYGNKTENLYHLVNLSNLANQKEKTSVFKTD